MKNYSLIYEYFKNNKAVKEILSKLKNKANRLSIESLVGTSYSLFIKFLTENLSSKFTFIFEDEDIAERIQNDLKEFSVKSIYIPPLIPSVYSNSRINLDRIKLFTKLLSNKNDIIILSLKSFLSFAPPKEYIKNSTLKLNIGMEIEFETLNKKLQNMGYQRVSRVNMQGEYRLLGEILDIFLKGYEEPIRITFDFETISKIRKYDILSQISKTKLNEIIIYMDKEVLWNQENIENLKIELEALKHIDENQKNYILNELKEKKELDDEEFYYSLAFKNEANILEYIKDSTVFFAPIDKIKLKYENIKKEATALYKKSPNKNKLPNLDSLLFSFKKLENAIENKHFFYSFDKLNETLKINIKNQNEYYSNITLLKADLEKFVKEGFKIFIYANTSEMKVSLDFILKKEFEKIEFKKNVSLIFSPLKGGSFVLEKEKVVVLNDELIFKKKKSLAVLKLETKKIHSYFDIEEGDYIVHLKYGIGKFFGITRIKIKDREVDYIKIIYKNDESILIPIDQLNLIEKYVSGGRKPNLDTIGGKAWDKKKERVLKNIQNMTDKLLGLYANRINSVGFQFDKDNELQYEFEASFPYQETEDQLITLKEVKKDMENDYPMDRLICGDVGFGKTEIALRAAFKAILNKKQVVLLAPTTVLAAQHYKTASERMSQFAVKIELLTRLVERKKQKEILNRLEKGDIDLLIGTHKVLQKGVEYNSLGLIIIDEEQKFGVKDKEKLKELKVNVDCLSMSATPIPRSMYMSLSGIRDISRIETPPHNRKDIETHVLPYEDKRVKDAIEFEINRGGQVYFLHNRVASLDMVKQNLKKIIPYLLIESIHGQMNAIELDDIMARFISGEFHLLLSTTIIENGIDIPNVNTIIIDRAENLGLSQIHQLRGRVGRSDVLAYAYLFYNDKKALSENAIKRLKAISENTSLGSGFKIAMMDMEIRGTGDIFGKEQSGDIFSVGFEMYMKLLEENVRIKKGELKMQNETIFDIKYSGFIPSNYIESVSEKIDIYKKISSIKTDSQLEYLIDEIKNRFGDLIPTSMEKLFFISNLKIIANELKIKKIKELKNEVLIEFSKMNLIDIEKLSELIKLGGIKINPENPSQLIITLTENNKIENITSKLKSIKKAG